MSVRNPGTVSSVWRVLPFVFAAFVSFATRVWRGTNGMIDIGHPISSPRVYGHIKQDEVGNSKGAREEGDRKGGKQKGKRESTTAQK